MNYLYILWWALLISIRHSTKIRKRFQKYLKLEILKFRYWPAKQACKNTLLKLSVVNEGNTTIVISRSIKFSNFLREKNLIG